MEPTRKTAALAGIWTALGIVPFDAWIERHAQSSTLEQNMLWLLALVVFLFVPGYFLVLGRNTEPFERTWFVDASERERYGVVFRRMLVWFASAGAFALAWSTTLNWLLGGS